MRPNVNGAGQYSDFLYLNSASFDGDRNDKVVAKFDRYIGSSITREFTRTSDGWTGVDRNTKTTSGTEISTQLEIKESWSQPPVLVATDIVQNKSAVVWQPNPHLSSTDSGVTELFHWTDETGKVWEGGLFKPVGYVLGKRYPLVLQTHGFSETRFALGGVFSTTFAARELAAAGIMVLQLPDSCHGQKPPSDEAPCTVRGFDAAIDKLNANGMIDPEKVGIVGFSRTVYHVEHALAFGRTRYTAASLTDGINAGYFSYGVGLDMTPDNAPAVEYDKLIGAAPFGDGLELWRKRSPDFNLNKLGTPVIVNALGKGSLLSSWGTYSTLRYMRKPVDIILFDSDEHVQTNPAVRLASQGGTVDWFRFWLQGYEDPSPDKAEQYRRWEGLCDMQIAEKTGQPTFCVPTKH
jgi:hypothetical protein